MADIELVIKINEDIAQGIIDGENDEPRNIVRAFQATIAEAIKNGTPLEDVLNKIRTEIESQRKEASNKHSEDEELQAFYDGLNDGLKDARDIIDKHRAEVESKNE